MHNYLNYKGLAIIPHRGGATEAPENTLASFEYSVNLGAEIIETDVQVSADGIPYVFHDNNLLRITGVNKTFSQCNSKEIDQIKIFKNHHIPKLEEVLHKFPNTKFQIDLKTDDVVEPALKILNKFNTQKENICLASFSSSRLNRARKLIDGVIFSMGPNEIVKMKLKNIGFKINHIQGDFMQVPIYRYGLKIVTKSFVSFVQEQNVKIAVWTINKESEMKYLIELGVDGIITDVPNKLKKLINLQKI